MYVQQLEHLKFKSFDELIDNVDSYIKEKDLNYEFAGILHDKDLDENDEIVKPHIHLQFYCQNKLSSRELKVMTKEDSMQYFDYMDNKVESFKYLIHDTNNSRSKYQYSMYDVRANFDYIDYIESTRSESSNLDDVLKEVIEGRLNYRDISKDNDLSILYVKHRQKFDNAFQIALEKKAQTEEGSRVSSIWIHSKMSGIGKTYLDKQSQ